MDPRSQPQYSDRRFRVPPTRADAAARGRELHGALVPRPRPGERPRVVHVAAVAGVDRRIMRIDERTPKSHADGLSLNLVRARADAIVISGQILRAEPTLSYEPGRPGPPSPALAALARGLRGASPPTLAILTRGDVPSSHPVFASPHAAALLVGPRAQLERVQHPPAPRAYTDRWTDRGASAVVAAVRVLAARGARVIAIEAGPRVVRPLYERDAGWLDEICLSTYLGPPLPEPRLAGPLAPPPPALTRHHRCEVRAASGRWRFERFVRPR